MKRLRKGARITVMISAVATPDYTGTVMATVTKGATTQFLPFNYKAVLLSALWNYPDLFLDSEGTLWARGWSDDAKNSLLATHALADTEPVL